MAGKRRPRAPVRAEVLPFPRRQRRQPSLSRWAPSTRSLVVGFVLLVVAVGGYFVARETSLFAVQTIEVEGAPPPLAERVQAALEPLVGTSLVAFSRGDADRRLAEIPEIATASYDRDFPHTLRVVVRSERPVAVLRQGPEAWLVSGSVRVLRRLDTRPYPPLPRIWIPRDVDATVGATLAGPPARAVRAVAPLQRIHFPGDVRFVRAGEGDLTLVLASGREVRLGDTGDLALKLAVAKRLVPGTQGALYIDVSVPERSVAGYPSLPTNSQVGG